jgi:hypothetical protein
MEAARGTAVHGSDAINIRALLVLLDEVPWVQEEVMEVAGRPAVAARAEARVGAAEQPGMGDP